MSAAYLTDLDISRLIMGSPFAQIMRANIEAQRDREIREMAEKAAAAIEAEMSDAGKVVIPLSTTHRVSVESAEDYRRINASRIPTPEQLAIASRRGAPKITGLSLAVSGDQGAGKTSALIFLIDALADAGILSVQDTRKVTSNIWMFLNEVRSDNEHNVEVIDLNIDLDALLDASGTIAR